MAWTCVFSKQSLPPALCGHTTLHPHGASRVRPPFSLSYGGNLPSSLTTVRPSPRYSLPDHLCRFRVRAARNIARGFSRQHRINDFTRTARHHVSASWCADLPTHRPTRLPRHNHRPGSATFLRHPIAKLLPTRIPDSPPLTRRPPADHVVSTARFIMGAPSRVREYQPVIHRLRLSASP